MINLAYFVKIFISALDNITKKDDNKDWPYRKLIIGRSGSGKTKYLLTSIKKDSNIINKIYLYAKDLEEPKYQFLIDKREKEVIKNLNDSNTFIEYPSTMDDILENIEAYNEKDNTISHVTSDKKAQQVLKSLFIRCRNLTISLCFFNSVLF